LTASDASWETSKKVCGAAGHRSWKALREFTSSMKPAADMVWHVGGAVANLVTGHPGLAVNSMETAFSDLGEVMSGENFQKCMHDNKKMSYCIQRVIGGAAAGFATAKLGTVKGKKFDAMVKERKDTLTGALSLEIPGVGSISRGLKDPFSISDKDAQRAAIEAIMKGVGVRRADYRIARSTDRLAEIVNNAIDKPRSRRSMNVVMPAKMSWKQAHRIVRLVKKGRKNGFHVKIRLQGPGGKRAQWIYAKLKPKVPSNEACYGAARSQRRCT